MKKYSIALGVVIAVITAAFFYWTAKSAKKKSDSLLTKFKEVDSSLNASTDSTHNLKGVGAIQIVYPISELKSQVILLIDSLKENFGKMPGSPGSIDVPESMQSDLTRLLHNVQQLNKFMWDMADSRIPDTIKY